MVKSFVAALAMTALTATGLAAEGIQSFSARQQLTVVSTDRTDLLPPAGYTGQWWTAPNNCEYSRSGRPGETVWFLIINTAHKKCDRYLVERGFSDAY